MIRPCNLKVAKAEDISTSAYALNGAPAPLDFGRIPGGDANRHEPARVTVLAGVITRLGKFGFLRAQYMTFAKDGDGSGCFELKVRPESNGVRA